MRALIYSLFGHTQVPYLAHVRDISRNFILGCWEHLLHHGLHLGCLRPGLRTWHRFVDTGHLVVAAGVAAWARVTRNRMFVTLLIMFNLPDILWEQYAKGCCLIVILTWLTESGLSHHDLIDLGTVRQLDIGEWQFDNLLLRSAVNRLAGRKCHKIVFAQLRAFRDSAGPYNLRASCGTL